MGSATRAFFKSKKRCFSVSSAGISGKSSVSSYNPVAWNDNANRISPDSIRNAPRSLRFADLSGK